jgi:hypothetical protein
MTEALEIASSLEVYYTDTQAVSLGRSAAGRSAKREQQEVVDSEAGLKLQRGRVGAPLHPNLQSPNQYVNARVRVEPANHSWPAFMTRGAPRIEPASVQICFCSSAHGIQPQLA